MIYNHDINESINKYLNYNTVLLLRQTFKNSNFKILKDLKVVRNMNIGDKIIFNDDKYNLKLNLYEINDLEYKNLFTNYDMNIIEKISYINIVQQNNVKKNFNALSVFLKNISNLNLKNLNTINLNIYMILSLNRYLNKNTISLFNNLENLIINTSNIEEKNILLYSNIIIEFLKKINIKYLFLKNSNIKFNILFKSYYMYNYDNNDIILKFI